MNIDLIDKLRNLGAVISHPIPGPDGTFTYTVNYSDLPKDIRKKVRDALIQHSKL